MKLATPKFAGWDTRTAKEARIRKRIRKRWQKYFRRRACSDCGAVAHGNITCKTCRAHMKIDASKSMVDFLNRLDALEMPLIPPIGPSEIQAFIDSFTV